MATATATRKKKAAVKEVRDIVIPVPQLSSITFDVIGTAPYVPCRFTEDAVAAMVKKQMEGDKPGKKIVRKPKDFDRLYDQGFRTSTEGWHGIHAGAFRKAMIDACRLTDMKMVQAKMTVFVQADGFDVADGMPLVKIRTGKPERFQRVGWNANGTPDIRMGPRWVDWSVKLRLRWSASQFQIEDIYNLVNLAGDHVGIGSGRPLSKNGTGCGWGTFKIKGGLLIS